MFISAVPEDAATGAVADYYRQQTSAWGFLPNYAAAFSTRPDVAAAWNALNGAIREGMDRRRFEIATIAAARALRSTYCTAAHSKFLRDVCGDEQTVGLLAADPSGTTLDDQDRAVYEFAGKVAADASSVTQSDVDRLRATGLSDAEIADIVFAAAARSFFTRVLDGLGARLDHQTAASFAPELLSTMIVGRPPEGAEPGAATRPGSEPEPGQASRLGR
ncbi:carboxymuconolactone decarboxylase family protein [Jatrophihabitans sp.]|uniref:carboxymuconolactone decarboxylase family protein n=1 Tax=Jatrophihabitans sp. TaxID=1932789 RepID=UPI002BF0AEF2|nr:peroxidase-related enzyme [Jatrophihabitans sp.]